MICARKEQRRAMSHTEGFRRFHHDLSDADRGATNVQRNVHVGKGESAQKLVVSVEQALLETGRTALRGVFVAIVEDSVVLRGRVPNYHEKQLAQATAQQIAVNRQVVSEIEVVRGP